MTTTRLQKNPVDTMLECLNQIINHYLQNINTSYKWIDFFKATYINEIKELEANLAKITLLDNTRYKQLRQIEKLLLPYTAEEQRAGAVLSERLRMPLFILNERLNTIDNGLAPLAEDFTLYRLLTALQKIENDYPDSTNVINFVFDMRWMIEDMIKNKKNLTSDGAVIKQYIAVFQANNTECLLLNDHLNIVLSKLIKNDLTPSLKM